MVCYRAVIRAVIRKNKFNAYHEDIPGRELASLDLGEELLGCVVGVRSAEADSGVIVEGLGTSFSLEVDLDVVELALCVDELEGVSRVTVHVVAVRGTAVREEDHDLMDGFRVLGEIVLQTRMRWLFLLDRIILDSPRTYQHPSNASEDHASECG